MAQPHKTGNPIVTADNLISEMITAPLGPDWTVGGLAEQVLGAIAAQRSEEAQEFAIDADAVTDPQSRRLLRPLLASLATKSAAETGRPVNLNGGRLCFKRPGPKGPVWIFGEFENRPGTVYIKLRRCYSPPEASEPRTAQPLAITDTGAVCDPSPPSTGNSR